MQTILIILAILIGLFIVFCVVAGLSACMLSSKISQEEEKRTGVLQG
jgi:flagellar basal body-associated protein FliL